MPLGCQAYADSPAARDQAMAPSPRIVTQHRPLAIHSLEDDRSRRNSLERLSDCSCGDAHIPGASSSYRGGIEEDTRDMLATSKYAESTVAPFLAEHVPTQYNTGVLGSSLHDDEHSAEEQTSTQYCYRHRPDMMCRRQANEPSMALLQKELGSLSQSDQQAISHVWSLFSAAPGKHRNLMLQGILTQCCFPQLSYISANVRELIKVDFLAALPAELGFKVLCHLDTISLCKAAQVSRRWRSLADDDVVWHRMCEQHIDRKCTKCGWGLPLLERKRLRIEKRQIQLRASGKALTVSAATAATTQEDRTPPTTPAHETGRVGTPSGVKRSHDGYMSPETVKKQRAHPIEDDTEQALFQTTEPTAAQKRPWKDVYKDRFRVGTNWKHGRFTTKVFKGHTNGVMCLQFDDKVLITGSYDTTAKVWDVNSGQLIRTLTGHSSGIRCLQFDGNKLMTGSLDHTIKLWNWKSGKCLRTFPAHDEGITTLHFSGPWVASGSMDQNIRVWNSETQQTFLLRGHTEWINSVKVDAASRTLFSASDDLTVKLWDLDTKRPIREFAGHVGQIQQVLPLPAEFEFDEHIIIHALAEKDDDVSSNASDHSFHGSNRNTPELDRPFWPQDPDRAPPPKYMLTGALDSTIRLWDVHFNPHDHPVEATTHQETDDNTPFKMLPTDPLTNSHTPRAQACLRTFFGHVEGIWALAADHLRLISGSEDRMMKVWDPRTGKCERTFTGHRGPVTCAWLSDSRVASGSEDCEVRMLCFGDP